MPVPAILDDLSALADLTRDRLLLLVESHELTVSELCSVLQLPQSTVSRHLKALVDSGWLTSRAEGTSRWYAVYYRDPVVLGGCPATSTFNSTQTQLVNWVL